MARSPWKRQLSCVCIASRFVLTTVTNFTWASMIVRTILAINVLYVPLPIFILACTDFYQEMGALIGNSSYLTSRTQFLVMKPCNLSRSIVRFQTVLLFFVPQDQKITDSKRWKWRDPESNEMTDQVRAFPLIYNSLIGWSNKWITNEEHELKERRTSSFPAERRVTHDLNKTPIRLIYSWGPEQ